VKAKISHPTFSIDMFTLTGLREYFYGFHRSHAALYFLPWMVAFDRCNKYLNIMIHSSSSSKASLNHKLELHPSSISGFSVKEGRDVKTFVDGTFVDDNGVVQYCTVTMTMP